MHFKTTLILILCTWNLTAQNLQIPLDQGRYTGATSIIEAGKDSFIYSTNVISTNFSNSGKTNNLTQISASKGILWSLDFQYPKTSSPGKLTNYKNDFLWTGFVSDVNQNKSLMRLDKKGNIIWSKRYGGLNDVDTTNGGVTEAIALPDGNIALAGGAAVFAATTKPNDLFLAKLDGDGNQLWAKNYAFSNLFNTYTTFSNVITTADGGFLLCGSIYTLFDRSILLLKTDADGKSQWIRSYSNETNGFISDELGVQVIQLTDGSYTLIANQNDLLENSGNIIAQINPNGTVSKAIRVRVNPNSKYTLQANKAIYDATNDAFTISAGVRQDSTPTASVEQNLLYKLRLDGSFDWKYNYYDEISVGFLTPNSDVVATKNGGFAHLTSFSKNFDNLYPVLILSDSKGVTSCEKPINLVIEKNISLSSKTFIVTEKNVSSATNYAVTKSTFNFNIKLPILNLGNDTAICKTDTSITLNAYDQNLDAYKWSTGAITPKITVSELGQYAVKVTSTKYCLTLTDTITITKNPKCPAEFKLDIANAFTPNGDGLNDNFGPFGDGFTIKSFQIYNRLGNLVFEGNDANKTWNGQFKGEDAASDVYVYALRYVAKGQESALSGEVILLR